MFEIDFVDGVESVQFVVFFFFYDGLAVGFWVFDGVDVDEGVLGFVGSVVLIALGLCGS